MSIWGRRDRSKELSLEEQAAIDIGKEMSTLSPRDLEDFGNRISDFIPLLVAQACRPTTHGLDGLIERCKFWGKKLIIRRGTAAAMPGADALEVLGESLKSLLAALEKYAPGIQQIFVDRVKRYRAEQERLRRPLLEAPPADTRGTVIEGEVVDVLPQKKLGPVT